MKRLLATIISAFCLTGLLGCSIPMMGGGEVYIGLQDNMFKVGHRVDRDLEGVTAKIALEVEASVLEALFGTNDEPNDEVSSPSSVDPGE